MEGGGDQDTKRGHQTRGIGRATVGRSFGRGVKASGRQEYHPQQTGGRSASPGDLGQPYGQDIGCGWPGMWATWCGKEQDTPRCSLGHDDVYSVQEPGT